jgi:SNF2 family DNA or RNA helicase
MSVELNNALLAKLAGWEAMKHARALVDAGAVSDASWNSPHLRGRVREGTATYQAGLVIRSALDADNLCPCRVSRQRGLICAHSVAVGLHLLSPVPATSAPAPAAASQKSNRPAKHGTQPLRRAPTGDSGEPLEISVILPPNLTEALARGHVMVYLEGQWSKGRSPLNAVPAHLAFTLSEQDAALLDALESLNDSETPAMLRLNHTQFATLLTRLMAHPRVTLGKTRPVQVLSEPLRLDAQAQLHPSGDIILTLSGQPPNGFIPGPPPWIFDGQSLRPLDLPSQLEAALKGPMRIPRPRVPHFLNVEWPALASGGRARTDFDISDFVFETAKPSFSVHLAGNLVSIEATLNCHYGNLPLEGTPQTGDWFVDPQSPFRYLARDSNAERDAVARLLHAGFSGPDPKGHFHLKGQDRVLNFFARDYPRWSQAWKVTLEERLERTTANNFDRLEPRFDITPSGEHWFDLQIAYDTRAGLQLSPADVQRLLRSGQSHSRLKNGKYLLLDTGAVEELQEVLLDCAPQQHAGAYRVATAHAAFLNATLHQANWRARAPSAWGKPALAHRGEIELEPPPLGSLEDVLRPYQKHGVAWIRFLRDHGFGGILADEMGLGKTLQALAHLATAAPAAPAKPASDTPAPAPNLVVCPTSLVHNWAAEATKFTPSLRVLVCHGPNRLSLFPLISHHDLVITSYALIRRDIDRYRTFEFDTVILDEAQHIKNRQSQNAQAVKSIRARHRLVLTGTPLENSILDLWSIFDFLMPGYLGAATDFRERYELPILRERNRPAQDRLARRLQPFVLRRLKRHVAADLPARIEQVSYCELTCHQRSVYQEILAATRRELSDTGPNHLAKSRMLALTGLLRLRQICCDLRLLNLNTPSLDSPEDADIPTSGKLELFNELLDEVLDGAHRVLVFSQFTRMLGLLRDELANRAIPCCYLDGSTKDRAAVVRRFQEDPAIPVFLISLKAGGLGLNLTGADTVVHFDPWWNPAVEAQATDRAHRIGQRNVVTSYKLITRGSVEEKILNLQARKRGLFEGLLSDEAGLVAHLSWAELQEILAD